MYFCNMNILWVCPWQTDIGLLDIALGGLLQGEAGLLGENVTESSTLRTTSLIYTNIDWTGHSSKAARGFHTVCKGLSAACSFSLAQSALACCGPRNSMLHGVPRQGRTMGTQRSCKWQRRYCRHSFLACICASVEAAAAPLNHPLKFHCYCDFLSMP